MAFGSPTFLEKDAFEDHSTIVPGSGAEVSTSSLGLGALEPPRRRKVTSDVPSTSVSFQQ